MTRVLLGALLVVLLALGLPQRAWALRCGTHLVKQGDRAAQVREDCGAPFFVDHYAALPGVGVNTPVEPGIPVVGEAWYYNFGPQRLMVRLDFSNGVLQRERTLGYGFVGKGGPCDYHVITTGMSVAKLIADCGFPARRSRSVLANGAYYGNPRSAPAWGETWSYPADGSLRAREVYLLNGRVEDVKIVD